MKNSTLAFIVLLSGMLAANTAMARLTISNATNYDLAIGANAVCPSELGKVPAHSVKQYPDSVLEKVCGSSGICSVGAYKDRCFMGYVGSVEYYPATTWVFANNGDDPNIHLVASAFPGVLEMFFDQVGK